MDNPRNWPSASGKPHQKPHPSLPQGEGAAPNSLKHSWNELPPLGEGMGRDLLKQQQL